MLMENDIIKKAWKWLGSKSGEQFLGDDEYCPSRDIFQGRLDKVRLAFERSEKDDLNSAYLLIAVIGEIGNNSFDHNLGHWRDASGIYFRVDEKNRVVVLADRGQGILSSIKNVSPDVKNDMEALEVAFTKKISGRFPEKRGNGLKFVANVAKETNIEVVLYSGKARTSVNKNDGLNFDAEPREVKGVLTIIKY